MTFGIFQFKELDLLSLYIYLTDSKSNKNTSYMDFIESNIYAPIGF